MNDYIKQLDKENEKIYNHEMNRLDVADKALKEIHKIMNKFGKEVDDFLEKK